MGERKVCCICGKKFNGWGNNPEGATWKTPNGDIEFPTFKDNDYCCDDCDTSYVIPGRLYRMALAKQKKE